jgi:hypothetical protein
MSPLGRSIFEHGLKFACSHLRDLIVFLPAGKTRDANRSDHGADIKLLHKSVTRLGDSYVILNADAETQHRPALDFNAISGRV